MLKELMARNFYAMTHDYLQNSGFCIETNDDLGLCHLKTIMT